MDVKLSIPSSLVQRLRPLIGGLRLVYLVILIALALETIFIVTRGINDQARARAESEYPSKVTQISPKSIQALESLQKSPTIGAASGKPNPFVP